MTKYGGRRAERRCHGADAPFPVGGASLAGPEWWGALPPSRTGSHGHPVRRAARSPSRCATGRVSGYGNLTAEAPGPARAPRFWRAGGRAFAGMRAMLEGIVARNRPFLGDQLMLRGCLSACGLAALLGLLAPSPAAAQTVYHYPYNYGFTQGQYPYYYSLIYPPPET